MTRTQHIETIAAANRRWFAAALCYLNWARDAEQPPQITLDLLAADIAALARDDHHADLKCLQYHLYRQDQPKPRRRKAHVTT